MDKYSNWLSYIVPLLCITPSQALLRGPWSKWGDCSANCDGSQERTRSCRADPGESCDGLTTQSRSCSNGQCMELSLILSIVCGVLILGLIILVIYLVIKRRRILRENNEARFNANAAEDFYDRSIVRSSSLNSRPNTTTSSIASSRATIPTIAPYLPDLEEEEDDRPGQKYINRAYDDDTDSLGKISFSNESIQEACLDFEVDKFEERHVNASPVESPKVKMMTFAGTQTGPGDDDSDLEVRVDII